MGKKNFCSSARYMYAYESRTTSAPTWKCDLPNLGKTVWIVGNRNASLSFQLSSGAPAKRSHLACLQLAMQWVGGWGERGFGVDWRK